MPISCRVRVVCAGASNEFICDRHYDGDGFQNDQKPSDPVAVSLAGMYLHEKNYIHPPILVVSKYSVLLLLFIKGQGFLEAFANYFPNMGRGDYFGVHAEREDEAIYPLIFGVGKTNREAAVGVRAEERRFR